MARQVRKTLVALSSGAALQRIAQFATAIVVVRSLELEAVGHYAFGLQVGLLMVLLIDSGVRSVAAREAAQQGGAAAIAWVHAAVRSRLVLAAGVFAVHAALVTQLCESTGDMVFWLCCGALVFPAAFDLKGLAEAVDRTRFEVGVEVVASFSVLAVVGLLALSGQLTALTLIAAALAGRLLYALCIAAFLRSCPAEQPVPAVRSVLKETGTITVVQFIHRAIYSADVIWIRVLTGSESAVALYFAASKIAQTAQLPITMLTRLFQPHIAHAVAQGEAATSATVERVVRSAAYLTLPIALGGALLAQDLLTEIYRPEFAEAGPVLGLLLASLVFIATGSWYGQTLFARREHRAYLTILGVGTSVNILCSLWWIPIYGAAGAAGATVLATAVSSTLGLSLVGRRVPIVWYRPLLRPLVLALGVGAVVWCLPAASSVFLRFALGGTTFALLLYALELRHQGWQGLGVGLQRSSGFLREDGAT